MLKSAALLVFACILVACSSDPKEEPQRNEASGAESAPSAPSTAQPEDQTAPVTSPAADDITPADSNTTLPAATLEEAAPPPEP